MMPEGRTVQSHHIERIQYEPNTQTLRIEFTNGAVYDYAGVPLTVWNGLDQAGSTGTYFWANIRNRYPTTRIS